MPRHFQERTCRGSATRRRRRSMRPSRLWPAPPVWRRSCRAGPTCWSRCRVGRLKPDLIVDTKQIPGHHRDPRGRRLLRDRRRDPGRHAQRRTQRLEQGLARHRRGRRPDRLDADPGPRLDRRQSVQRLAGRRQRAGGVSPRARSPSSPARNGRREVPVEQIVTGPGPHLARTRASSSSSSSSRSRSRASATPICASSRAPRWTSRWSAAAVNVTLDADGTCTDARVVLGAVAPTQLRRRGRGRGADRPQARRGHAEGARRGGAGRLQADQRQARHDRIPHQGRRRAGAPGGRHRIRPRHGRSLKGRLTE